MESIYSRLYTNIHFKTISTQSRSNSYDSFSQALSTSILRNEHCQMIVCGPRKVGKMRMVRHVINNLLRINEHQERRIRVVWLDAIEKQHELFEIVQSSIVSWIRMSSTFPMKSETNAIDANANESSESNVTDDCVESKSIHKISMGSVSNCGGAIEQRNVTSIVEDILTDTSSNINVNSNASSVNASSSSNLLGNQFDIISDDQLGKLEVLMTAATSNYNIYPIFIFRQFDRICKLANKFVYHLLDLMHTTNAHFTVIGISQAINLHTILDKGTGTTGKLGGTIGSYTRIKSRLYSGKFILVRAFRTEKEIVEAIQSVLELCENKSNAIRGIEIEVSAFNQSLKASLSQPMIFTPLLLYPDCSSLVHICRFVVHRLQKRKGSVVSLADWTEAIDNWIQNENRLKHIESFTNLQLCMLLAARDVEEIILTPSQESSMQDQRMEMKEEWFSFGHVYTRYLKEIAMTSNQDIIDTYANQDHMIPDITTDRSKCQSAYRFLFEKGFLKRLNSKTIIEDSKARFQQIHPQEIRTFISRNASKFHSTLVKWAESHI